MVPLHPTKLRQHKTKCLRLQHPHIFATAHTASSANAPIHVHLSNPASTTNWPYVRTRPRTRKMAEVAPSPRTKTVWKPPANIHSYLNVGVVEEKDKQEPGQGLWQTGVEDARETGGEAYCMQYITTLHPRQEPTLWCLPMAWDQFLLR